MPRKKVLYVEDNVYNQRLVRKLLEPHGLKVEEALDGLQGIRKSLESQPDLILMDLNLPYLDGIGTTTKIKSLAECQHIPVVALVSTRHPEDRERAMVAGCDGIIDMPLDAEKFPEQVREFLAGKRASLESNKKSAILKDYSLTLIDQLQDRLQALEAANRELASQKLEVQRAFEQSQKANEELRRLHQLKQHIVAVTSHELRTPLSLVAGYIDVLRQGMMGPLSPEQIQLLEETQGSMQQLQQLIERIAELGRIGQRRVAAREEKISLAESFRAVRGEFGPFLALRQLALHESHAEPAVEVLVDPSLLKQVFSHLLRNAICFTPNGGSIEVRSWCQDGQAAFHIRDQGIGIAPEHLESVFEEFFQAQSVENHRTGQFEFMTRGLGLGLAICRSILTELGGKIWAESQGKNAGAAFTFLLPKAG
jgi:signal transduction histidine kinase